MGSSLSSETIDCVDDGFFICSLEPIKDIDLLQRLGITHILNAAGAELYDLESDPSGNLRRLPELFTVEVLDISDEEDCNLSVHFQKVADFIEQGRRQGKVVVHCAAGISRSSTSVISF